MATLRQIITDAYRESGITQIGEAPDANQLDEGFRKLITFIESLYGFEMGAPFVPISYGKNGLTNSFALEADRKPFLDSYYVHANYRLMANLESPTTVFLAPNPVDGTRFAVVDISKNFDTTNLVINGNGRLIEDSSSVTLNTAGTNEQWFYRADLGNWVKVTSLTVNSQNPFPAEFDDLLITKLAMRLNPRYLQQTASETVLQIRELEKKFRAKYKQIEEVFSEVALYRINQGRYMEYHDNVDSIKFSQGLIY